MRTIAYNVYKCAGWPEEAVGRTGAVDGNDADIASRLIPSLDSLDPDVLTFAEAPLEAIVRRIGSRLNMDVRFFPSGGSWPGALLSRFQVTDASHAGGFLAGAPSDLFTRHAGRAVVNTEAGETVLYSVHLHPTDDDVRKREIARLLDALEEDRRSGYSVVLQGDLNHRPTDPEYEDWREAGLTDTLVAAGTGPTNTAKADTPQKRIDYVWVSGGLADRLRSSRVAYAPPFGPGSDRSSSSGPFLSDHLPVIADFE